MKNIGFKNFRKYKDFKPIEFAPITILVGGNNAGKSTVVKAMLTLNEFMKDPQLTLVDVKEDDNEMYYQNTDAEENPKVIEERKKALLNQRFYFNKNYYTHIGTFNRALNNASNNRAITFYTEKDRSMFEIVVEGDGGEESVSGKIALIRVSDLELNIVHSFDFNNDHISCAINSAPGTYYVDKLKKLKTCIEKQSNATGERSLQIYEKSKKELELLENYFANLQEVGGDFVIETSLAPDKFPEYIVGNIFDMIFGKLSADVEVTLDAELPESQMKDDDVMIGRYRGRSTMMRNSAHLIKGLSKDQLRFIKQYKDYIAKERLGRGIRWRRDSIEYIYAHAVTQTVVYNAKDKSDYLVRTIDDFVNSKSLKENKHFVERWMKEFGIGKSFEIKPFGGEAYIVKIKNTDGKEVNLADKGMGSIQLMVLLFRLAILLEQGGYGQTVIIEEPEQNLHPAVQSKLVDLFYEVGHKYGCYFVVETHSEYFIRKCQLKVAQLKCEDMEELEEKNPFKIYYFNNTDSEEPYFDLGFRTNGMFKREMGTGFLDEADNLFLQIGAEDDL